MGDWPHRTARLSESPEAAAGPRHSRIPAQRKLVPGDRIRPLARTSAARPTVRSGGRVVRSAPVGVVRDTGRTEIRRERGVHRSPPRDRGRSRSAPLPVFTVGHSTRTRRELVDLLKAHGIHQVVDIRSIPRSRFNPQFNQDSFSRYVTSRDLRYRHAPGLGGLRRPRSDSSNTAWRNLSFRGFADYMQSREFESAIERLVSASRRSTTVLLCAEAVPWRCHRSLIGDALSARKIPVIDLIGRGPGRSHRFTPWGIVRRGRVSYPKAGESLGPNRNDDSPRSPARRRSRPRRVSRTVARMR
ncbi:MAG: DUF488 family protein [Thermoplasmata archaeon]